MKKLISLVPKKVLYLLLLASLVSNVLMIKEASAGWNHLVTNVKWSGTTATYDVAGGFNTNQESIIKNSHSRWENASGLNFNQDWYSGNDWWEENIDSLGDTSIYINADGTIDKVETRMDQRSDWNVHCTNDVPSNEYDFCSVVIHEYGHWFFLEDDNTHSVPVMDGTLREGESSRVLQSEDKEAASYMY